MSLRSTFTNAFRGLWLFLKSEPNNRIHISLALLALAGGWIFHIGTSEWLAIILSVGLVLSAEAFNASLERLCDMVHKDHHPRIKAIKDISAGAVLIAAAIAVAVALVIFAPRLLP
ncbi:MAG TPA: diacylglycerol kinase family protein [Bacteroidales bacterium]|nr:diacylglycerol kinase family protein [Bacteroidales bacterium]